MRCRFYYVKLVPDSATPICEYEAVESGANFMSVSIWGVFAKMDRAIKGLHYFSCELRFSTGRIWPW